MNGSEQAFVAIINFMLIIFIILLFKKSKEDDKNVE